MIFRQWYGRSRLEFRLIYHHTFVQHSFQFLHVSHLLAFRRRLPVRGSGCCRDRSIFLGQTVPSFSVGSFLLDFPGFQFPPDSIFPSHLRSSSRALPLHLHFCNCSDVFSFTSPFDVSKPFQPSPSHNRRYCFHLCFFQDLLISPVF